MLLLREAMQFECCSEMIGRPSHSPFSFLVSFHGIPVVQIKKITGSFPNVPAYLFCFTETRESMPVAMNARVSLQCL